MVKLPSTVPEGTNWLDASYNYLNELCDSPSYLRNVSSLNFRHNRIGRVCDNVLRAWKLGNLQVLDLSANSITALPTKLSILSSLKRLWLSGNPYVCDCTTMWMKDWVTFMTSYQNHVVQDIYDIFCVNFDYPMYALDRSKFHCLLIIDNISSRVIISLCVLAVFAATVVLSRRRNELKWLLYLHFGISFKRDKDTNIAEMNHDCYLSYW